jgi:hypothetical protein
MQLAAGLIFWARRGGKQPLHERCLFLRQPFPRNSSSQPTRFPNHNNPFSHTARPLITSPTQQSLIFLPYLDCFPPLHIIKANASFQPRQPTFTHNSHAHDKPDTAVSPLCSVPRPVTLPPLPSLQLTQTCLHSPLPATASRRLTHISSDNTVPQKHTRLFASLPPSPASIFRLYITQR